MVVQPRRFQELRGLLWRIDLGVLPPSDDIPVLRRAAADSRRRYANLRRHLLIDPHLSNDEDKVPDLSVENPLSQSPDSMWEQFFRNSELEKMLNQDLSRLYPELGGFFQTDACKSMLGRILLVWTLSQLDYGYRQGMHELLAPLLYVLHNDVQHYYKVRLMHEELFSDDFDGKSFQEGVLPKMKGNSRKKPTDKNEGKIKSLDELDPTTKDLFLINDPYGAEGELGILVSEKFMEHDAYCLFEYLMKGADGVVAIADFFSLSPASGSSTGLTPVREASAALYHFLSHADSSLHSHLVELGVEPQYFALRWLRVLFGREFSVNNLLCIWDEIFSSPNQLLYSSAAGPENERFKILCSHRGALILSIAVSMILYLRTTLLASEHTTAALQRLLSFPEDVDVDKLLEKAKLLQRFVVESDISSYYSKGRSLMTPSNYWEEEWMKLQSSEDLHKGRPIAPSTVSGKITPSALASSEITQVDKISLEKNAHTSTSHTTSAGLDHAKLKMNGTSRVNGVKKDGHGESASGTSGSNSEAAKLTTSYALTSSSSAHETDPISAANVSFSSESIPQDATRLKLSESSTSALKVVKTDENMKNTGAVSLQHQGENSSDRDNNDNLVDRDTPEMTLPNGKGHDSAVRDGSGPAEAEKDLMALLGTLSQSMVENIEVIQSIICKDNSSNVEENSHCTGLVDSEFGRAMSALSELRKISNLLSDIRT